MAWEWEGYVLVRWWMGSWRGVGFESPWVYRGCTCVMVWDCVGGWDEVDGGWHWSDGVGMSGVIYNL